MSMKRLAGMGILLACLPVFEGLLWSAESWPIRYRPGCHHYVWCNILTTKDKELDKLMMDAAEIWFALPHVPDTNEDREREGRLIAILGDGVRRWPKVAVVHAALGDALRRKASFLRPASEPERPEQKVLDQDGRQNLEEAYKLDPANPDIMWEISFIRPTQEERLSLVQKYRAMRPDDPRGYETAVWDLVELGRMDEAMKVLKEGAARSESGNRFRVSLSHIAYLPLKERIEADLTLKTFVANTPDFPYSQKSE